MDREQFAAAIQKGLGRALMHVRANGAGGLEDLIVGACVHDPTYDSQCEPERWPWLIEIVDVAGLAAQIEGPVIAELAKPATAIDYWHRQHQCSILAELASRGSLSARDAVYGALGRSPDSADIIGVGQIIDLDGRAGLLHVAAYLGRLLRDAPDSNIDDEPVYCYDSKHADGDALGIIAEAAAQDSDIKMYFDHLQSMEASRRARDAASTQARYRGRIEEIRSYSAEQIIAFCENRESHLRQSSPSIGVHANSDVLTAVAEAMFRESDAARLRRYLRIFTRKGLPVYDRRIIPFLDHDDERVRWFAAQALAHHAHEEVRELAVMRLQRDGAQGANVNLFQSNYRSGDHRLIEDALRPLDDADKTHNLIGSLLDVFKANSTTEGRVPLLFAYEHSPCAICRMDAVQLLVGQGLVPAWLREECRFDANEEMRELVSGSK